MKVVETGKEALNAVKKGNFNIVLMDVQMPEMDGYEATRCIRRLKTDAKDVSIVAMTANAMKGDREACLEAGMDDYLPKPVSGSQLKAMLDKFVSDSRERNGEDDRGKAGKTEPQKPS
ncbi:MAG: response regulator [Planctomycetota bacterium]|nr:response regulator [Planctomycetota bacterium]